MNRWLNGSELAIAVAWLGLGSLVWVPAGRAQGVDETAYAPAPPASEPFRRNFNVRTSLYAVRGHRVQGPFGGRDGGIAAVNDAILIATRAGDFYAVNLRNDHVVRLGFTAPVASQEFHAEFGDHPDIRTDAIGIKDIAVRAGDGGIDLYVSDVYWHSDRRCVASRVSSTHLDGEIPELTAPFSADWTPVFETEPCVTGNVLDGRFGAALMAGGRIELLDDDTLFMTVGDYHANGLYAEDLVSSSDTHYGKTLTIDVATGEARIFSTGHRNPQGLVIDSAGDIYITEHGPRGGDELNRLTEGGHYGWPLVTYGTDYGTREWPLSDDQGRHDGYEQPLYAWVPSIGISNLVRIRGDLFPLWRDDFLVSSLREQTLYRVRMVDGAVVLVEPMPIGHAVRDMVQTPEGTIAIKTDDDLLVTLRPR